MSSNETKSVSNFNYISFSITLSIIFVIKMFIFFNAVQALSILEKEISIEISYSVQYYFLFYG